MIKKLARFFLQIVYHRIDDLRRKLKRFTLAKVYNRVDELIKKFKKFLLGDVYHRVDELEVAKAQLQRQDQMVDCITENLQALLKISSTHCQQMDQLFDMISQQSSQIHTHHQQMQQVSDMISKQSSQDETQFAKQNEMIEATSQRFQKLEEIVTKQGHDMAQNQTIVHHEFDDINKQLKAQIGGMDTIYKLMQYKLKHICESTDDKDIKLKEWLGVVRDHTKLLQSNSSILNGLHLAAQEQRIKINRLPEVAEIERQIRDVFRSERRKGHLP